MTVTFAKEPDFTTPGTQEVALLLTDEDGNTTELTATLTVLQDTTPPVISGVTDQEILLGETVAYKKGVTVTDDYDENVELEVDSSQVNPTVAGDYLVTYRATDRSGNTAEATAYFSFTQPSEYTDLALEEAQKVLDKITTEDMTQTEVAKAIYDWCRPISPIPPIRTRGTGRRPPSRVLPSAAATAMFILPPPRLCLRRRGFPISTWRRSM